MTHLERFYATIERRTVDRPANWLGLPVDEALPGLFKHFGVENTAQLKKAVDDDIWTVEMPYNSPDANAIYSALNFTGETFDSNEKTLTSKGFFADYDDPTAINEFNWPDPTKYIFIEECKRVVDEAPDDMAIMGMMWSAHFQDACSAFGMENALIKMLTEPEMYMAVSNKIVDFYLKANEIFYEATKGKLHAVLIGNDLGSQQSLMLSPELIRKYVLPGTTKLVQQAKSYGLKVIHHSCGAIFDIIPDLINAGVDAIHPIQALAKGMEATRLKAEFSNSVSFCGGVDAQNLLVFGGVDEVRNKVLELKTLFPTGLIISPSHEAILPDILPQNIEALFDEINRK